MENNKRYTFRKGEKLKSRKAIEQLFRQGRAFSNFPFRVLWMINTKAADPLQAGFTVSGKHFKKAVDRNRIKRLMREAYRLQKNELQEQVTRKQKPMAVFFIYVGNELPEYDFIFIKTGQVINRLIKIANEDSMADT